MSTQRAELGFDVFDADNHYYEATDAFTRHLEPGMRQARACSGPRSNGKPRLWWPGKLNRFIPNPLFDPVARPGVPRRLLPGPLAGRRHPRRLRRARADQPEYREPRGPSGGDGRAGYRGLLHVPDPGRRHGGGAAARPRGRPRRVPGVQPVARRRLGPALRDRIFAAPILHACSTPTGRWPSSSGCSSERRPGDRHAGRAGDGPERRSLARRPGVRPVLGAGRPRPASPSPTTRVRPATAATRPTGASRPSSRRSGTRR